MVLPILGPLIGAGASLLGGFAANRAQNKANRINLRMNRETNLANRQIAYQTNKTNLRNTQATNKSNRAMARRTNAQAMKIFRLQRRDAKNSIQSTVRDAEKAGINPLTAIRGGQTYTGPQAPALTAFADVAPQASMGAPMQAGHVQPVTGLADGIRNAGDTIYSALANAPDPEREMLEKQLLAEELNQMQQKNAVVMDRNFGYSIPHVTQTSGVEHGAAENSRMGVLGYDGVGGGVGDPNLIANVPITEHGGWSDAELMEERYGDVASSVYGLGVMTADAVETVTPYLQEFVNKKNIKFKGGYGPHRRDIIRSNMEARAKKRTPPSLVESPPWFDNRRAEWTRMQFQWGIR
jgi:hypothetical protein